MLYFEFTAEEEKRCAEARAAYPAKLAAAKDAANTAAFTAIAAGKKLVYEAEDFCQPAKFADLATAINGSESIDDLNTFAEKGWLYSDGAYYHF